jgi:hypothetical protein
MPVSLFIEFNLMNQISHRYILSIRRFLGLKFSYKKVRLGF